MIIFLAILFVVLVVLSVAATIVTIVTAMDEDYDIAFFALLLLVFMVIYATGLGLALNALGAFK